MTISSINKPRRKSMREGKEGGSCCCRKALGGGEGDVRGQGAETKREGTDGGSKEGGKKAKAATAARPTPPRIVHASARRLNTKIIKATAKDTAEVERSITNHCIIERIGRAHETSTTKQQCKARKHGHRHRKRHLTDQLQKAKTQGDKETEKNSWKLSRERSNALTGAGSTLLRANPEAEVFGWCQERVETAQSSSMKASRQWKRRYLRKSTTKGFISGSKHLSAKAQCAKPLHIWQQQ